MRQHDDVKTINAYDDQLLPVRKSQTNDEDFVCYDMCSASAVLQRTLYLANEQIGSRFSKGFFKSC